MKALAAMRELGRPVRRAAQACVAAGVVLASVWAGLPGCSGSDGPSAVPRSDASTTDAASGGSGGAGSGGTTSTGGAGGSAATGVDGSPEAGGSDAGPFGDCIDPALLPKPPEGIVDVGGCAAVTACGGTVDGEWRASEACIERDLFSQVYGVCATAQIGSVISSSLTGGVTISGGVATRKLSIDAEVTVTLPNNCSFCQCQSKEAELSSAGFIASCSPSCSPDCFCTVRVQRDVDDSLPLVDADAGSDAGGAAYCVTGDQLELGGTFPSGDPLRLVLQRDTGKPPPEVCNGVDDDGNGLVDDQPVECPSCSLEGVCASGVHATCGGAQGWQCSYDSPKYEPIEQSCDGVDNDCNGLVDEPSYCGPEICDGRDNDGNGLVDDDPSDAPPSCLPLGVCSGTAARCDGAGGWACHYAASYEATETKCDGLDNDCNGETDEPQQCCVPRSCASANAGCGSIDDGCNGTRDCGNCPSTEWCEGGGQPNRCGCTPSTGTIAGPFVPGDAVNDVSYGVEAWSFSILNLTTADAVDGTFPTGSAYVRLSSSGAQSQYLVAKSFGFALPAPAVVRGIEVQARLSARDGFIKEEQVRLVRGGAVVGTNHSTGTSWPTSYTVVTYGGPTDLWGASWTAADIDDPSFGVAFATSFTTVSGNDDARIDELQVTVYYDVLCN